MKYLDKKLFLEVSLEKNYAETEIESKGFHKMAQTVKQKLEADKDNYFVYKLPFTFVSKAVSEYSKPCCRYILNKTEVHGDLRGLFLITDYFKTSSWKIKYIIPKFSNRISILLMGMKSL